MKSKLLPAIIFGALTGAALSMLDKDTRKHTAEATKKLKETISYYAKNREELQQLLEDKVQEATTLYNDMSSNIASIKSQVEDAKTLPNTVMSLLSETKDAFSTKTE